MAERLHQAGNARSNSGFVGISGNDKDPHLRPDRLRLSNQVRAALSGHEVVGDEKIRTEAARQYPNSLLRLAGFRHGEAELGKHVGGTGANESFVIDQENFPGSGGSLRLPALLGQHGLFTRNRKP